MSALLVAAAHKHAAHKDWRAVLCLPAVPPHSRPQGGAGALDAGAVRKQYRRMAAHVHPDKCQLHGAARAFQLISQALETLIQGGTYAVGSTHTQQPGRSCNQPDPYDSFGFHGTGQYRCPGDASFDDGAGPGQPGSSSGKADGGQEWQCGANEFEGEEEFFEEGYEWGGSWQVPAERSRRRAALRTLPTEKDDEPLLWSMSLEDLRLEVASRQRSVLVPSKEAAGLTATERQRQLRAARTVLSARLAPPNTNVDGGCDPAFQQGEGHTPNVGDGCGLLPTDEHEAGYDRSSQQGGGHAPNVGDGCGFLPTDQQDARYTQNVAAGFGFDCTAQDEAGYNRSSQQGGGHAPNVRDGFGFLSSNQQEGSSPTRKRRKQVFF
eukprot:gene4673-14870_t